MSVELCGCGHILEGHRGRQCQHEAPEGSGLQKCPCPQGMRSDIAIIRLMTQLLVGMNNLNATAAKELAITQAATNTEAVLTRNPDGTISITVRPMTAGLVLAQ